MLTPVVSGVHVQMCAQNTVDSDYQVDSGGVVIGGSFTLPPLGTKSSTSSKGPSERPTRTDYNHIFTGFPDYPCHMIISSSSGIVLCHASIDCMHSNGLGAHELIAIALHQSSTLNP